MRIPHFILVACTLYFGCATASASSEEYTAFEQYYAQMSQNQANNLDTRVSATLALGQYQGPNAIIGIGRASRDVEPRMRIAAIDAVRGWSDVAKWDVVSPILNDKDVSVQRQALYALLPLRQQLNPDQLAYVNKQAAHYLDILGNDLNARHETAKIYSLQGEHDSAETIFIELLTQTEGDQDLRFRTMVDYSNLMQLTQRNKEAVTLLTDYLAEPGAEQRSDSELALLEFRLGIAYLRMQQLDMATVRFEKAYQFNPDNGHYGYTLATMLQSDSPSEAATIFNDIYRRTGQTKYLYAACQSELMAAENATQCLNELRAFAPADVVNDLVSQFGLTNNN